MITAEKTYPEILWCRQQRIKAGSCTVDLLYTSCLLRISKSLESVDPLNQRSLESIAEKNYPRKEKHIVQQRQRAPQYTSCLLRIANRNQQIRRIISSLKSVAEKNYPRKEKDSIQQRIEGASFTVDLLYTSLLKLSKSLESVASLNQKLLRINS